MTTREWADARQKKWTLGHEYRKAETEYNVLTKEFLKKLTWAKNQKIISVRELEVMRFRLRGKTLEEVGREFDVTRERIRTIEESIVERLIEL